VNAGVAPLRHPSLPLERLARHRGAMLPAAWMPRVQSIAAEAGQGVAEPRGTRLAVYLPDTARDRAFVRAVEASLGDVIALEPVQVRSGDGAFAVRPVMRYNVEVPLRLGGALRGELHRHGVEPDAFDVKLHAAQARGRAPLDALLDLVAWLDARAGGEATLAMEVAGWEPQPPGPRAA
jgi:hypothetical protein